MKWLESERENLGYPTQKPLGLLRRIIETSSRPGEIVLDPFCGCGTAVEAAHGLGRRWIGIDISQVAVGIIRRRMRGAYGIDAGRGYAIFGEPRTVPDAAALAEHDRFQFQCWAVNLLCGLPVEAKKGADRGVDGRLYFHDEPPGGKTKLVILSVKSGGVSVTDMRDLRGVIEREKAEIGVLVTLEQPTKPMRHEAADAGYYRSPGWGTKHPRLQIITVEELLSGGRINMPAVGHTNVTFAPLPKPKAADKGKGKTLYGD